MRLCRRRLGYSTHVRKEREMPIWEWILIAVSVVIVVAVVVVAASVISSRKKRSDSNSTTAPSTSVWSSETGSQKGAENELTARERKREEARHCSVDALGTLGLHRPLATRCRPSSWTIRQPPSASLTVW